jgi:glutaredoxin
LDNELVSASPLHIAAREVLDINGNNIWDYNAQLDLVVEGRLIEKQQAVVQWPQIILDEGQEVFCYDIDEVNKIGLKVFYEAFREQLLKAVESIRRNERRPKLRWRSIPRLPRRGRFPPRVFTRHKCYDLRDGISFECRYHGSIDQNDVLSRLDKWQIDLI